MQQQPFNQDSSNPQQQQWTPPPPQPQPYPPQYQPPQGSWTYPPQPPQKKPSRGKFIAFGCLGALILLGLGIAIGVGATTGTNNSSLNTSSSSGSTTSSSSGQPTPKVGEPFVVNDAWTVTVNKVSTSQGNDIFVPKAGDIFLVVDVTLKNTSSSVQHASGLAQWSLKDSTGQTYSDSLMGNDPGGTIPPGGLLRGQISYEVPKSLHTFTLQFVPDLGGSDLAEWNLSI